MMMMMMVMTVSMRVDDCAGNKLTFFYNKIGKSSPGIPNIPNSQRDWF